MTTTEPPAGPPPRPEPTAALAREVDRLARRLADADLPGLAADLLALTARADEQAARAERVEAACATADGHIRALARAVQKLAGPTSGRAVSWLTQTPRPAPSEAGPGGQAGGGQAGGPGGPGEPDDDGPMTLTQDEAVARLEVLARWLAEVYLRYPGAALPSCWAWHPAVVEELMWLHGAHVDAYTGRGASWMKVGDWHDRQRPGVVKRIGGWLGTCDLSRHTPTGDRRERGVPVVPLADQLPDVAACWSEDRSTPAPDLLTLTAADAHDRDAAIRAVTTR